MNIEKFHPHLIVIAFISITFFLISHNSSSYYLSKIKSVVVAGQSIKVDLALTSAQQMQGLSGRAGLDDNAGMLFIFARPGKYYFWMKNMNFALDTIWIGKDMKVIYIKKSSLPQDFLETYGPDIDAKYVLEVASGFSDKNNLKEGDSVLFTY